MIFWSRRFKLYGYCIEKITWKPVFCISNSKIRNYFYSFKNRVYNIPLPTFHHPTYHLIDFSPNWTHKSSIQPLSIFILYPSSSLFSMKMYLSIFKHHLSPSTTPTPLITDAFHFIDLSISLISHWITKPSLSFQTHIISAPSPHPIAFAPRPPSTRSVHYRFLLLIAPNPHSLDRRKPSISHHSFQIKPPRVPNCIRFQFLSPF